VVLAAAALLAASRALAEPTGASVAAPASASGDDELRRKLLLDNLPGGGGIVVANFGPAVLGTASLAVALAVLVENDHTRPTERAVFLGASGGVSAVAFATYLAPRPLRLPLLVSDVSLLMFGLGLGAYYDPYNTPRSRTVFGIVAGVGAAEAAIPLLDAMIAPPLDYWALDDDRHELEGARGNGLHESVRRAERDVARTIRPLRFVGPLVYLGGATAMAIASVGERASGQARGYALAFGLPFVLFGATQLAGAVTPSSAQSYEQALRTFRVAPVAPGGGAGLAVSGRF
jgi:hypothetical protein